MLQFSYVNDNDFDHVLLMAPTKLKRDKYNLLYLNIGCSNHMTRKFEWFLKLDKTMKMKITFADNIELTFGGIRKVLVLRKDSHDSVINNVLYISMYEEQFD